MFDHIGIADGWSAGQFIELSDGIKNSSLSGQIIPNPNRMLTKLLDAAKLVRLLQRRLPHKGRSRAMVKCLSLSPSPLKIVLPGGVVELYYMAVPAGKIMEAHPSFMVARPEVFRRPWDSVLHPDEILKPGEKFFLVPLRTIQKLRRRIRKPNGDVPSNSFASQSSMSDSSSINEASYSTDTETQGGREHHMRFSSILFKRNDGDGDEEEDARKMNPNTQSQQRMRRVRNIISWRPSLTAITE